MKRMVPLLITAICGFILIIVEFIPTVTGLKESTEAYYQIIGAFSAILGAASLLRNHGEKIRRRVAGWGYSGITVAGFLATMILGLFKVGVPPTAGVGELITGPGQQMAEVQIIDAPFKLEDGRSVMRRTMTAKLYGFEPNTVQPLALEGEQVAEVEIDARGLGTVQVAQVLSTDAELIEGQPIEQPQLAAMKLPQPIERPEAPQGDPQPVTVAVGSQLSGALTPYSGWTGDFQANGTPIWFAYQYLIRPLQSTMFALLAFYVASAAFRAFRARNAEAAVLLLTAFLILLGRTFVGTWVTSGLPEEGFWSFFQVPNLTSWLMLVFNTAGNRAIIIGIALGIVATSLKILLGIDRSYLGGNKG